MSVSSFRRNFPLSVAWRLADDAARRRLGLARWAVCRRLAPAIGSDRVSPWFDAREPAETCQELAIGHRRGRLAGDVAMASVVLVARRELPRQAFVDRPGTEDQQVVARDHPVRDVADKSIQVFDAVWLAGRLRDAAAAVTDCGIVPDVARGPVVSRHFGLDSFDRYSVALHADDDCLPRIDPYKRAGSAIAAVRGIGVHRS
jgi:hypothetical protein